MKREFLCDELLTAFSDIVQGFCLETSIVDKVKAFSISFDLRDNLSNLEEASCFKLLALVDSHPAITKAEDQECFNILFKTLPEEWQKLFLEPPHFSGRQYHLTREMRRLQKKFLPFFRQLLEKNVETFLVFSLCDGRV